MYVNLDRCTNSSDFEVKDIFKVFVVDINTSDVNLLVEISLYDKQNNELYVKLWVFYINKIIMYLN